MMILNTHTYIYRRRDKLNLIKALVLTIAFSITATCLFGGAGIKTAWGAKFYFDVSKSTVRSGDLFEVILMLDPEGETINAVEGSTSFSRNLVLKQIRSGDSLVGLWIEPPTQEGDHVVFAGIIPGGYSGELSSKWKGVRPGRVFSILFEARESGDSWIQVDRESTVLLHDGKGSEAHVEVEDMTVKVQGGEKTLPLNVIDWEDEERPEPFEPIIELFSDGSYYLIFVARDKGSGISHYEIREGEGSFVIAESPYCLEEQDLGVQIVVRAVDKSGNSRLAFLLPEKRPPWYESIKTCVILFSIGVIMVSFIFIFVSKLRWRRSIK